MLPQPRLRRARCSWPVHNDVADWLSTSVHQIVLDSRKSHAAICGRGLWLTLFALLSLLASRLSAQTTGAEEYQVKAVFLFNFTQFVAWPANAFVDSQSPIVIGVLGDDPFGEYLDETVRSEKVDGRPLVVFRYHNTGEIKACHVLFISQSETARLKEILAQLKDRSVLTVGDQENFSRRGGMVRFYKDKNRVRLRVNVEAVKAAGLSISSKLFRFAEIVGTEGGEP